MIIAALLMSLPAAAQAPAQDPIAWLQHIYAELRQLRSEILEYRRESQASKIPELERELQQVKEQHSSATQALAELDSRLRAGLSREEREEFEVRRTALIEEIQRASYSDKEAVLQSRLARERERLQRLTETARLLGKN